MYIVNYFYYLYNYYFNIKVKFKLLNSNAKYPTQTFEGNGRYDIYSSEKISINSVSNRVISTGLSAEISKGYYMFIAPTNDSLIKGIDIDIIKNNSEIKILMINNSCCVIKISKGDKIAEFYVNKSFF